jgi:hypothetical protein
VSMSSTYAYDRMKTHQAQAAHARLATEARAAKHVAGPDHSPHRHLRLRIRGVWFSGRPVNVPG